MSNQDARGKGGNFDKRKNPFMGAKIANGSRVSFTEVSNIGAVLDELVESGCAIMFGRTRDGGALVLTVLDNDERYRTYCSSNEELQRAFEVMDQMYKS